MVELIRGWRWIVVGAGLFCSTAGSVALAVEPDHVQLANQYVATIDPANNNYASPLNIDHDGEGILHAESKCGSYAAHLFKAGYPTVTNSVFTNLFGSTSPKASLWYAGLLMEGEYTNELGTFSTHVVTQVTAIQSGDVLAAAYTSGSSSGHVMVVQSLHEIGPEALANGKIPGYTSAIRWEVLIHDSTSSAHGSEDTRDQAELGGADDKGLGLGKIVLYEDSQSGQIIGWKWSTKSSRVYQCVAPEGTDYRPMVAGYLAGPGLPE